MKIKLLPLVLVFLAAMPAAGRAQAPRELAGFVLGGDVRAFEKVLRMETALPVRHARYITEVETRNLEGYKSGIVGYGSCQAPDRILRIKLKYADPSEKFYAALLERFKKRFGEPDEWRGDPFHIVQAWKWSFRDSGGATVSLVLQHNTQDYEEKIGNAVKMTLTSQLERERACWESGHPEPPEPAAADDRKPGAEAWDRFVPR